ncbi:ATP synthase complex subunit H-domain-containing protein [Mycena amicta]|nr:ATP synthase complex subunit H-domain-containing protein [Mycena amicta]
MSAVLRRAAGASRIVAFSRPLSSSAVARKDIVQDLYLKEIKSYKAPVLAKDAHVGVVKAYTMPPTPKAPALPSDLASELSAYDTSEPVTSAADSKSTPVDIADGGAEAFLEVLEADVPHEHH